MPYILTLNSATILNDCGYTFTQGIKIESETNLEGQRQKIKELVSSFISNLNSRKSLDQFGEESRYMSPSSEWTAQDEDEAIQSIEDRILRNTKRLEQVKQKYLVHQISIVSK